MVAFDYLTFTIDVASVLLLTNSWHIFNWMFSNMDFFLSIYICLCYLDASFLVQEHGRAVGNKIWSCNTWTSFYRNWIQNIGGDASSCSGELVFEELFQCLGGVMKELRLVQLGFCEYLDTHLYFNRYEILLLSIWASVQPACCLKMSVCIHCSVQCTNLWNEGGPLNSDFWMKAIFTISTSRAEASVSVM